MTHRDKGSPHPEEMSGEKSSMTERMLDLIRRFDAEERRGRSKSKAGDQMHQRRRRDDEPAQASNGADDLIVQPVQSE